MKIELPYPPSVNHYWGIRVAGKRAIKYIGAKGKQYREDVIRRFKEFDTIEANISITMFVYKPDRRKRDLDNILKCPFDAMQHAGIYYDDSQIKDMQVYDMGVEAPGKLIIYISNPVDKNVRQVLVDLCEEDKVLSQKPNRLKLVTSDEQMSIAKLSEDYDD